MASEVCAVSLDLRAYERRVSADFDWADRVAEASDALATEMRGLLADPAKTAELPTRYRGCTAGAIMGELIYDLHANGAADAMLGRLLHVMHSAAEPNPLAMGQARKLREELVSMYVGELADKLAEDRESEESALADEAAIARHEDARAWGEFA